MNSFMQSGIFVMLIVALSIPIGTYIYKVMNGDNIFLSKVLQPIENGIYKFIGVKADTNMSGIGYVSSIFVLTIGSIIFVMLLQMFQGWLPMNPEHLPNVRWDLALNTAVSYVTNTNWQAYAGEITLSYFTQFAGLTVQSFISPAVGIAVAFGLMRGFVLEKQTTIGNFWKDLTRILLYILVPLAFVFTLFLMSQGVVQTFSSYATIETLQSGIVEKLPLGPAASQIAIKMLGTNGGGFFGANGAFPFENPTVLSNFIQIMSIIILPASMCVTFGKAVQNRNEGRTIYIVMLIIFILALTAAMFSELTFANTFANVAQNGNMEGKETMHGITGSTLWGVVTTAVANGSVNAMHASFTPLATAVFMFLMQLGEIIFGGAGSGLYGMVGFIILTVFIVGLMVGRTPEYLGKKIEPFDIKMVCLMILIPPMITLFGGAIMVMHPNIHAWLGNSGVQSFSEILYNAASLGNNNGSAFAGMTTNTVFLNVVGAFMMFLSRFLPMIAVVLLSANLANKQILPKSAGALSTTSGIFTGTTVIIVLIIGALSFLPALALGPIADFLSHI